MKITKIEKLCHQILFSSQSPPVPISFMSDLDAPDHNGSLAWQFYSSIKEANQVVITTPTLLNLTFHKGNKKGKDLEKMNSILNEETEEQFNIYKDNSFVIFVPKKIDKRLQEINRS